MKRFTRSSLFATKLQPFYWLALSGMAIAALTISTPFAFRAYGDNAYIALAIPAGLLTIAATCAAERAGSARSLWLIFGIGIALRLYALLFDPLLSTDIYRYIWDGRVQAAGINPYRYFPAQDVLSALRDAAIFPKINRADYAVTIYPPVAQYFFLIVTRIGESVTVMRLALLGCESISVVLIVKFLRRMDWPVTRVVAYLWHPLPIWEIANSGHIDALMVALMLLGLWIGLAGRAFWGVVTIALAMLVKPYAAPALVAFWRPWDWKVPLTVIVVFSLCYLPYLSVGFGAFGFLTQGYLTEEGIRSGDDFWLLSLWRLVFGGHRGDAVVYLVLGAAILLLLGFRIAVRPKGAIASSLADINMLLLATLLVLSPNYPWYFLMTVPFAALCGNAPTWAMSIGALLLTNEVEWDFYIPALVVKSLLYGGFILGFALSRTKVLKQAANA